MNTIKRIFLILVFPVALLLTGCSVGVSSHTDHNVTSAPKPSVATQTDPLVKGFGDVITYKDGVSLSVSKPATYTPTDVAAGTVDGQDNLAFTIVVTNNSKKNVDVGGFPQVTSGGQQAHTITDLEKNVGVPPVTTLLPGKSIKWVAAFSVADPKDVTIEYTPGFDYDQAIFDSNH